MPQIGIQKASLNINLRARKDRNQLAKVYTDEGRRVTAQIPVDMGCLVDDVRKKAFLSDPKNQFMSRKDGMWYQVLGERSTIPICMITPTNVTDLKKRMGEVYRACKEKAKFQQYIDAAKNVMMDKIIWLAAIGVTGMILYYLLRHFWG